LVIAPRILTTAHFFSRDALASLGSQGNRPIQIGDAIFFRNITTYNLKHPHGEWHGIHAICVSKGSPQKFIGFGLSPSGVSENEIFELFIQAFNEEPIRSDDERYGPDLVKRFQTQERVEYAICVLQGAPPIGLEEFLKELREHQVNVDELYKSMELNPGNIGLCKIVTFPNLSAIREAFREF